MKMAVEKGKVIAQMTSKDWYKFLLSYEIEEDSTEGGHSLIPCRVEIQCPQNDWPKSWSLARLKGLSSTSMTFLWKLLHQLLPTRERQHRILRDGDNALCGVCNYGEVDSVEHALATCADSRETFEWMKIGLGRFSADISTEQILKLDFFWTNPQYLNEICLLYTSPSPRDLSTSRMPSSA